jgi:hypothetical protein
LNVWSSFESTTESEYDDFAEAVAANIKSWLLSGGAYSMAGVIRVPPLDPPPEEPPEEPEMPNPSNTICGFDDYFSIQIKEHDAGQYMFLTKYHELPSIFLPTAILSNGQHSECGADGGALAFFKLIEDVEEQEELQAQKCTMGGIVLMVDNPDYDPRETIPDPEDPEGPEIENPDFDDDRQIPSAPETVYNWEGLLDNAEEGYVGLFAYVDDMIDNPDYQPDEELPDFDPLEKKLRKVWAFVQGACINPPGPPEP